MCDSLTRYIDLHETFLQVYRAQFGKTIAEEKVQEPYVTRMIGMLAILLAISVGLFSFLRKYGEYTCLPLLEIFSHESE